MYNVHVYVQLYMPIFKARHLSVPYGMIEPPSKPYRVSLQAL